MCVFCIQYVCVLRWVCGGQRWTLDIFLYYSLYYILETMSPPISRSWHFLGRKENFTFCQCWGYKHTSSHPAFDGSVGDMNSGPHSCKHLYPLSHLTNSSIMFLGI